MEDIVLEPLKVEIRLAQLDLNIDRLQQAVRQGVLARLNVTDNYPKTAPGWYQYAETVSALRDLFLGECWEKNSTKNIESIYSTKRGLKVAYASVDRACSDSHPPQAISTKGDGTIEACSSNHIHQITEQLEFNQSDFNSKQSTIDAAIYYLMVDHQGRAELSLVTISESGEYEEFLERIYIIDTIEDHDIDIDENPASTDDDIDDCIEVSVVRK